MVKRRVVQAGANLTREIAEEAGRKLSGGIKRHTPERPPGWDWGWKGGKPGEITGGQYLEEIDRLRNVRPRWSEGKFEAPTVEQIVSAEKEIENLIARARKQLNAGGFNTRTTNPRTIMENFQKLEQADVPREWTGKVLKAIGKNYYDIDAAKSISNAMRPMSNESREIFLQMLPRWQGSLDELANAVVDLMV